MTSAPTPPTTAQTLSRLAVGIVRNLQAKATRFQLALEPAGLGRVDVNVRIGADGAVSAALHFDNAAAAEALKARAGELRTALEQAGFNLTGGDLSFTTGGFGRSLEGGPGGQGARTPGLLAGADAADADAPAPPPTGLLAGASGGLDIRI
jgi:Meckel syndrome type 1 protein